LKGDDPAEERVTRRNALTVKELSERYLAAADKGFILGKGNRPKKASSLYVDRGRINRHILPLLGSKRVPDLKGADINRFMADVASGKTSTVQKTRNKRGRASTSAALRKLPQRSATSAYRRCLSSIGTGDHASLGGNGAIEERTVSRVGENRAGDVDSVLHHLCHAPHAVLTDAHSPSSALVGYLAAIAATKSTQAPAAAAVRT
jgi:hypothetical protein